MKERLIADFPDSALESISFSGNENVIEWEEEGKEFAFNGQMYDVVRCKEIDGKIVYLCFNDQNEDQLLEQLNENTKSNRQENGKTGTFPDTNLAYDLNSFTILWQLTFRPIIVYNFIDHHVHLPTHTISIVAPPPDWS